MYKSFITILLLIFLAGCDFNSFMPGAQEKFVDQGYKTAIALIELHKLRTGQYPNTLNDIKYTGDWDQMYRAFINYKKLETGYSIEVKDSTIANKLTYPSDFWSGLGVTQTNVQGFSR